jgi:Zn-dependent protease
MLIRFFSDIGEMPTELIIIRLSTMLIGVLLCLSVHELCHGLAAYALGDPTAKRMGRLSVNPIRHLDPIGSLMLLVAGFGWARPVQVDPRYFENPKRDMALVALAGPVSNFVLAFLMVGGLKFTLSPGNFVPTGTVGLFLFYLFFSTATMSIGLGIFNLVPIPPLDGSKVLASFLPSRFYWQLMQIERYGMFILLFLVMTGSMRGFIGNFLDGILSLFMRVFGIDTIWILR